jgi:hypothetical protein
MPDFIEFEHMKADEDAVKALLQDLLYAWEAILKKHQLRNADIPVQIMNGFMALHNFHKAAIDHIVSDLGTLPQVKMLIYKMAGDTFDRSMHQRIEAIQNSKL